jgi:transcription elongation factor GreA
MRDYANNKKASPDSELFSEMFSYFTGFFHIPPHNVDQQSVEYMTASYLLIDELSALKSYSHLKSSLTLNFADVFAKIKNAPVLFKSLKDTRLKMDFLGKIKMFIAQWSDVYVKLFSFSQLPSILEQLEEAGFSDKLTAMCIDCFDNLRENREAALWLYKNSRFKKWFLDANIGLEKQLITLIHILDATYRDIENHKDTVENKKINKIVHNILFKDGEIAAFISNADEDAIIRIFTFINNVKDLDPQDKLNLRSKIVEIYPEFKFFGDEEKKVSRGLVVTKAMFEEKNRQLAHIMDVEVPANSKEIEYALSQGDLRENAEYKAAKEKQEQLNFQIAKLKEEIERAQQFDPDTINTSKVSFGTKVTLLRQPEGKKEEFTILGPWESDPKNHIISYLSPFGKAIINRTAGETFEFVINEERLSYLVEGITPANI